MAELVVFSLGSLGLVILSHPSLIRPTHHGFPRFFAFEALLGLVVQNARKWFSQPLSLAQIASWGLLLVAIWLAIYAFWALHTYGLPDPTIRDSSRLGIEKTSRVVTEGPYHLIRHPLYASLLCLAWGAFLKQVDLLSCVLVILASSTLFITARFEEKENLHIFGEKYAAYMEHTKRFIPKVF